MLSMGGTDMSASSMSGDISLLSSAVFMIPAEPLGGDHYKGKDALKKFSVARPAESSRATVDQRKFRYGVDSRAINVQQTTFTCYGFTDTKSCIP